MSAIIVVVSLLWFLGSFEFVSLFSGIIALLIVCISYYSTVSCKETFRGGRQGFTNYDRETAAYKKNLDRQVQKLQADQTKLLNPATLETYMQKEFEEVDRKNPMGNVLLTQIYDNPQRKAAPPSFNPQTHDKINERTKRMIQNLNPSISSTNKQLFGSTGERYEFEQSQRQFFSNPNTQVENNQGAFADWLYGGMISAKEGHPQAMLQDNPRYNLY